MMSTNFVPLEYTGDVCVRECDWDITEECVWAVIVINQNVLGSKCL